MFKRATQRHAISPKMSYIKKLEVLKQYIVFIRLQYIRE